MSLIQGGSDIKTTVMDHHGLVAAVCRDLGIIDKINARVGSKDPRRVIQPGLAVAAMIINGLGFTNRRLYLTPQFFESKAIEYLFSADVAATDFDAHTLGKALDEISAYGSSRLYGEIAFEIAMEKNLLGERTHLDTTSFSVHGEYNEDSNDAMVEVTYGFSKDHRPDLKQVMMSLTMTGPANIPIWMEPLNGNSSDKKSFHETISRVQAFQKELSYKNDFFWIADSALYTPDKLLSCPSVKWISRVPENIKCCSKLVKTPAHQFEWQFGDGGYQWVEVGTQHGGINQRWLLVFSKQAYEREKKTFMRRLEKEKIALSTSCWHLGNVVFDCPGDAEKSVQQLKKSHRFHHVTYEIKALEKFAVPGRPNPMTPRITQGYQVLCVIEDNQESINETLLKKGRFVLATNDLDDTKLPSKNILEQYKEQQNVENGFRFLKDPWFMVNSFYVKTRRRIEALMMVMTLCLMVYNFAQYRARQALQETNETVPNQVGKPINNPTLKWIFQIMEGISIVKTSTEAIITNIDVLRCKIIRLFGVTACQIYGLQPELAKL